MKIEVTLTKEHHDCMLAGLRKKNVGTDEVPVMMDDLTVQEWVQAALDGKVHNCMKRAHMTAFNDN